MICCPIGKYLSKEGLYKYSRGTTRLSGFSTLWCTILVSDPSALNIVKEYIDAAANSFLRRNVQVVIQQPLPPSQADETAENLASEMARTYCQTQIRRHEITSVSSVRAGLCPCCRSEDQRIENINGGYVTNNDVEEKINLLPSHYRHKCLQTEDEEMKKARAHSSYLYETTSLSDFYSHDRFTNDETNQLASLILLLYRYIPEKINDDYRYLNPPYDADKSFFENLRTYSQRLIDVHEKSYDGKVAPADIYGRIKKQRGGKEPTIYARVLFRLKFRPKEGKCEQAEESLRGHSGVNITIANGNNLWEEIQECPHVDNHLRPRSHQLATTLMNVLHHFCKPLEELDGGGGLESFLQYSTINRFRSELFEGVVSHVKNGRDMELSPSVNQFIHRFTWMFTQRCVGLSQLSQNQVPLTCFGNCGRLLSGIGRDEIYGDWCSIKKPSNQLKELKQKRERESMFGDKICKGCYAESSSIDMAVAEIKSTNTEVMAVSDV